MTSAQATSLRQSSHFGTNPSAMSRSFSAAMQYLTSCPSFASCQAMSLMRPESETNRNLFCAMVRKNAAREASKDSRGPRLRRPASCREAQVRRTLKIERRPGEDDARGEQHFHPLEPRYRAGQAGEARTGVQRVRVQWSEHLARALMA